MTTFRDSTLFDLTSLALPEVSDFHSFTLDPQVILEGVQWLHPMRDMTWPSRKKQAQGPLPKTRKPALNTTCMRSLKRDWHARAGRSNPVGPDAFSLRTRTFFLSV